ncbi:UPF0125 protein yfjF [Candidatus Paraburkholderia kirkii]|nr:UPF0125 protein yfjF [Candidatus Paraburkholderia kirkii]
MMRVDVCYGLPDGASFLARVDLRDGATVREAIEASGVLRAHREIDLATQKVGVFGKVRPFDAVLAAFDRVEIYRPLKVDPKTARQRRVDKARKAGRSKGASGSRRTRAERIQCAGASCAAGGGATVCCLTDQLTPASSSTIASTSGVRGQRPS